MANLDANKVRFTRTGAFFEAPLGTPFPTDTSTPLGSAWTAWGYLGPDGPSRSLSSKSSDIKAWQDNETIATINTDASGSYTIPAMETRKEVIETVFGTVVNTGAGSYTITPGKAKVRKCFVLETVDPRTLAKVRECFIAECSEVADSKYTSTDAFIIVATFKVFGDITVIDDSLKAAGSGNTGNTGGTTAPSLTLNVSQTTDTFGDALSISGQLTGKTVEDSVEVHVVSTGGTDDYTTFPLASDGTFSGTWSIPGGTASDVYTVTATTKPMSADSVSKTTEFTYPA